jgi:hypothetical protein
VGRSRSVEGHARHPLVAVLFRAGMRLAANLTTPYYYLPVAYSVDCAHSQHA